MKYMQLVIELNITKQVIKEKLIKYSCYKKLIKCLVLENFSISGI